MRRHGVPAQILTDNGKVFTGRFGPGTGEVLFDRICRENGIRHLLTAPRSPTTTGKVERFHRTLRQEFLTGKVFDSIDRRAGPARRVGRALQPRPAPSGHRDGPALRTVPARPAEPAAIELEARRPTRPREPPVARRRVGANGRISFASTYYLAGVWLAGETVEIVCDGGVVHLHHRGVLVATHARRHKPAKEAAAFAAARSDAPTPARDAAASASAASVTRKVDSSGNVSFAGTQLPGRQQVPSPPGPGRRRRRHRRDQHRRGAHPHPPDPPRPHPRTRRPRQPRRPTPQDQRRLNPRRLSHDYRSHSSHGYRALTWVAQVVINRATRRCSAHPRSPRPATVTRGGPSPIGQRHGFEPVGGAVPSVWGSSAADDRGCPAGVVAGHRDVDSAGEATRRVTTRRAATFVGPRGRGGRD